MAPKQLQVGPETAQDVFKMIPEQPKMVQNKPGTITK
jgi:hypothetical protein